MKAWAFLSILTFSLGAYAHDDFPSLLRSFERIGQNDPVECTPPLLKEELDSESQKLADKKWFSGAPDCSKPESKTPPYEVVEVNSSYYVMRQNKCINFEAPFLYLFIGSESALLIDTGATESAEAMPLRAWVDEMLKKQPNGDKLKLVVAHSHSHGDHTAGDEQFMDRANTTVVGYSPEEVARAFNIKDWPNGEGEIDLGGRKLSVLPIPGHEASSIAVYDHKTKDLISGDTLYPGNIFLSPYNYKEFKDSVNRMYEFSKSHKIRNILGAHVEMSDTPGKDFPYGSTYQPDEHKLPLRQEHLDELHDYLEDNDKPVYKKFADFIINV